MKLWNVWYQTIPKKSNLVNTTGKTKTKNYLEMQSKCTTSIKKDNWKGSKFTPSDTFMINNLDLF